MFRTMAVSAALVTFAVASDWCQNGHRADGQECSDIIEAFLEDVLEVPKTLSGRRLLSADDMTSRVEGGTTGEQFAFLVNVAIHGNRTSAGWHLTGGRRLSEAGMAMKLLIDDMVDQNDDAVDDGHLGRQQAQNRKFDIAKNALERAMNGETKSKRSNIAAQHHIEKIGGKHHMVGKITGLLKSPKVMGAITGNMGIVGTAINTVAKFATPIVSGLKWLGNKVLNFLGWNDARPVAATTASNFSSIAKNAKLFSLMAAGMITLFAAVMVGLRHGKKLGAFMRSLKERNGLSDDEEYAITGTSE